MRICDIPEGQIKVGMRVRSLARSEVIGTIVEKENVRDQDYWWIKWDGDSSKTSGFFWNNCKCEVVE